MPTKGKATGTKKAAGKTAKKHTSRKAVKRRPSKSSHAGHRKGTKKKSTAKKRPAAKKKAAGKRVAKKKKASGKKKGSAKKKASGKKKAKGKKKAIAKAKPKAKSKAGKSVAVKAKKKVSSRQESSKKASPAFGVQHKPSAGMASLLSPANQAVSKLQQKQKKATVVSVPTRKTSFIQEMTATQQQPTMRKHELRPEHRAHIASESIGMSALGIEPYVEKPGEAYMNEKQLAHFRNILLKRKQLLMEEVDQTVAQMRYEANYTPADINDRATMEEMLNLQLRERNREGKLLKKIEEALDKIERSEYGFCDACGVEIGIRRLEARPTATLCIDCKTLDEIKERQQGG